MTTKFPNASSGTLYLQLCTEQEHTHTVLTIMSNGQMRCIPNHSPFILWSSRWPVIFRYPNETEQLWSGIQSIVASAQNIILDNQLRYYPETAVFVDEISYPQVRDKTYHFDCIPRFAFQPMIGYDGNENSERGNDLTYNFLDNVNQAGIAFKQYLLTDLINANIDFSHFKFAVSIIQSMHKLFRDKLILLLLFWYT